MSAQLLVPFNFCPLSISVKTGSYTIPAGQYARVTVNLEGTATFTVNAVIALRGTSNSVLASDNLRTGSTSAPVVTNALLTTTDGTSASSVGGAFNETTDQKVTVATYFVPTGTVIDGTGTWRAVVELYNQIT